MVKSIQMPPLNSHENGLLMKKNRDLGGDLIPLDRELATLITSCAQCAINRAIYVLQEGTLLIHCDRSPFRHHVQWVHDNADPCPQFQDRFQINRILTSIVEFQ